MAALVLLASLRASREPAKTSPTVMTSVVPGTIGSRPGVDTPSPHVTLPDPDAAARAQQVELATIAAGLESSDRDDRTRALSALRQRNRNQWLADASDVRRALGAIIGRRGDPMRAVALETVTTLGAAAIPMAPLVERIVTDASEPVSIRMLAAGVLGRMAPAGEDSLISVLDRPGNPIQLRVLAARSLVGGCQGATDALARAASGEDALLRYEAISDLGSMASLGRRGAVAPVGRALQNSDPDVRQAAVEALARMGAKAGEVLPEIRSMVLGKLAPDSLWPVLVNIGPPAEPLLVEAADSDATRYRAVEALAQMRVGAKGAIPRLRALEAEDGPDAHLAVHALREIGPTLPELAAELAAPDAETRVRALAGVRIALRGLHTDGVYLLPFLRAMLKDPAPSVRREVPATLVEIGPPAASSLSDIASLLSDGEARVRSSAALALGELVVRVGREDVRAAARAALEPRQEDPDGEVRQAVGQSLRLINWVPAPSPRCPDPL